MFTLSSASVQAYSPEQESTCLSAIHQQLAPYANLPGLRGHLENHFIQKVSSTEGNIFFWDQNLTNTQGEPVVLRTISTLKGTFQCKFPASLSSEELVFDVSAIASGGPDILKRDKLFRPRRGISCKPGNAALLNGSITSLYLSLIPDFYTEARDVNPGLNPDSFIMPLLETNSCSAFFTYRDTLRSKRTALLRMHQQSPPMEDHYDSNGNALD